MSKPSGKTLPILGAIIGRDLKIAHRSGGTWLMGLIFFAVFISLCAIALGGQFSVLRPLAPALIWLAGVFSLLFSFEHMFRTDTEDGSLAQIKLSGISLSIYVLAKAISHWVLSVLPLILVLPLVALMFDIQAPMVLGLGMSLLIASPALIAYGAFSGACLVSFRGGGFLLVLLTIPLVVPVLIFAISGATHFASSLQFILEFRALAGISLIASAIAIPAAAAALNVILE